MVSQGGLRVVSDGGQSRAHCMSGGEACCHDVSDGRSGEEQLDHTIREAPVAPPRIAKAGYGIGDVFWLPCTGKRSCSADKVNPTGSVDAIAV